MIRRVLAIGLAGALVGCANGSHPMESQPGPSAPAAQATATLGETFRLRPGEIASVSGDGVLVNFRTVLADSRCPSEALILCVWEGNAEVQTAVKVGSRAWTWHVLNTTLEPKRAAEAGYIVTLVELAPYPRTTDPIDPAAYVATYRVDRR